MMISLLYVSSRSASFELNNDEIYYAKNPYNVFLNGKEVLSGIRKNVFSVYDLKPSTCYTIKVEDYVFEFTTLNESATVNVSNFETIKDGITDDTLAIQKAIFSCPKNGRVLFEKGTYLVGPLFLKDNITIELPKDTVLLGQPNRDLYPILPAQIKVDGKLIELSSWEGEPNPTHASVITGLFAENVSIIGEGVIDENAQNSLWWLNHKEKYNGAYRAKGVFLSQCKNIVLQGITVMNTPSWNIHPYFSQEIRIIDVKLLSPKDSPNTDGCNPESCDNVDIIGVDFSVGDDCIAIKSGKYEIGMKYREPSQNITIRNCRMAYGHGAVVLGSEMSGGVRNLSVSQCLFEETDRGLRIKTRRGRGESAIITDILFEKILMNHVKNPFVINMFYFCDEDGKTEYVYSKESLTVDERTPYLGNFIFKDILCENVHHSAGFFYGLPERPIESITFDNVKISYTENVESGYPAMMSFIEKRNKLGIFARNVNHLILKNLEISGSTGNDIIVKQKIFK